MKQKRLVLTLAGAVAAVGVAAAAVLSTRQPEPISPALTAAPPAIVQSNDAPETTQKEDVSVEAQIKVELQVTGGGIKDDKYVMRLSSLDGAPLPAGPGLNGDYYDITMTGPGIAGFPEITFTKAGNYYYRVTHVSGMRSSATYDSTVYDVHVTVVKKDGELMYEVAIRKHGQEQPKYDECLFIDHFPGSGGSVTATPYRQPTPTPRPTEAPAEGIRVIINQLDGECFE